MEWQKDLTFSLVFEQLQTSSNFIQIQYRILKVEVLAALIVVETQCSGATIIHIAIRQPSLMMAEKNSRDARTKVDRLFGPLSCGLIARTLQQGTECC